MPSKYRIREFAENQCYHVFHRGIQKTKIFLEDQDYQIFLYYLNVYLGDPKVILAKYPNLPIRLQAKNLNNELEFISYCLMPNHLHFLLKQSTKEAVSKFMKQLLNAYTFYFNKKYERTGPIFEGRYKAVRITSDELLLHVSRYIHLNPVVAKIVNVPESYKWSSHKNFIEKNNKLIKPESVLGFLKDTKSYHEFVRNQISYAKELDRIKHLTID